MRRRAGRTRASTERVRVPRAGTNARRQAIVIGGGLGGIAAALRLRARGYSVTLYDQCDQLGGRAQTIERGGFRFDTGPTVLCAPWLVEELFALFGKRLSDHLALAAPQPWYRFLYPDGSRFDYGPGTGATEAEISRLSLHDVAGFRAFMAHAGEMYDIAFDKLAGQPSHDPGFLMRHGVDATRLRAWQSVWTMARRHFRDERLQWAFSMPPLLLGGHPARTSSLYALISHLEQAHGVWFPKGGMGSLVWALGQLMADVGVDVRLSTKIREVLVENGVARGVRLEDGRRHEAAVVVSNCDPLHLYGDMVPKESLPILPRLRLHSPRMSMGVFVMHLGTRRRWPAVAHHNVLFHKNHRRQLDATFDGGLPDPDSALYVSRPTATDPSLAPVGCDSFYVLCPVPNLQKCGTDWQAEAPRLRAHIINRLERTLLPGLSGSIAEDVVRTPRDCLNQLTSVHGAGFSLAPHLLQTAFFRFHNRGEGIRNLFLVGAGTHPGAGVPAVLQSAKAVDTLVPAIGEAT